MDPKNILQPGLVSKVSKQQTEHSAPLLQQHRTSCHSCICRDTYYQHRPRHSAKHKSCCRRACVIGLEHPMKNSTAARGSLPRWPPYVSLPTPTRQIQTQDAAPSHQSEGAQEKSRNNSPAYFARHYDRPASACENWVPEKTSYHLLGRRMQRERHKQPLPPAFEPAKMSSATD